MVTVCPSQFATRRTLFHVLVGCGLLMLKVSRLKLPVIWQIGRASCRERVKIFVWGGALEKKNGIYNVVFFFSSRRRHTRSVSAFLLNRSSDLGYAIAAS